MESINTNYRNLSELVYGDLYPLRSKTKAILNKLIAKMVSTNL